MALILVLRMVTEVTCLSSLFPVLSYQFGGAQFSVRGSTEKQTPFLPCVSAGQGRSASEIQLFQWMNERGTRLSWQEGYGAFSVSASNISAVTRYIENQEAHHRKITFDQEFVALLRKHGIEFDPKYV